MFICDCCNKSSESHTPCTRIIIEKRTKEYEYSVTKGTEEKPFTKVTKSRGWEIVKEQKKCVACMTKGQVYIDSRPMRMSDEERKPFEPKIQLPYDILPTYFPWQLQSKREVLGMLGRASK